MPQQAGLRTQQAEVPASGREGPGLGDLWYDLSARGRRTAAAAACLLLVAAGGYALTVQAPWQPARQGADQGQREEADGRAQGGAVPEAPLPSAAHRPVPYPAQSARITFDRVTGSDSARRAFTIRLHAAAASAVTVEDVGQGYESLDIHLAGRQPVKVRPGATRALLLEARITDCDRPPGRSRSPLLNVTLRNDRKWQELTVAPGERYADALAHAFRTLCPSETPAATPRP